VKDSGIVMPGRGGMLDSVDSMVLTAPLFYYFFTLVGR
jgi:phosphatidate cytidylyltransferase